MNKIEKIVYSLVKKNTNLKGFTRDIYQSLMSILPHKKIESDYSINIREGYFFGFHDKSPFSFDDKLLLAHKFNMPNRPPLKDDIVEIGFFDGKDYENFNQLSFTNSWNWQQGSMLQWVGDTKDIIFNKYSGLSNIATIIDVNGVLKCELEKPIGAISANGEYAASYNFDRLNIGMKGYGYANFISDNKLSNNSPSNCGLYIINLKSGKEKMLFSIDDIKNIQYDKSMEKAYHFFTHTIFSPNSKRILFLHRWYIDGRQLFSRLISCDLDGLNIHVFPTQGMVSHFTWVNNDKVFAYCNINNVDSFYLMDDLRNNIERISTDLYNSDGHPQFNANNKLVVNDSYPNRNRIMELSIFDLLKMEKHTLAKIYSPLSFKDLVRCDLHPRWDRSGNIICFDSPHLGVRSLCTISLS